MISEEDDDEDEKVPIKHVGEEEEAVAKHQGSEEGNEIVD